MLRRRPEPQRGFTLLELLVAIAILALVAVGSYELLFSTISTRDQAMARERDLRSLQRAEMMMQRDLLQTVQRPVRDEFGDLQPGFSIPQDNSMEFTRLGWRNPLQEVRSELVRVRWRVINGQLVREHWPVLDRARTSTPVQTVMLDGVSDFRIAVHGNGAWAPTWPPLASSQGQPATMNPPLPDAVEVTFSVARWGTIRRVFILPEGSSDATAAQKS
ncbi:MAG TPA: type II secretion system minor pseudopilin GspJ [Moraxellaceae bacterium]|nr:type II secretion system minor pseudopilin GspJ [Moraxellaceae bacterium]